MRLRTMPGNGDGLRTRRSRPFQSARTMRLPTRCLLALLLSTAIAAPTLAAAPVELPGFDPSGKARTVMAGEKKSQNIYIPSYRVAFQVAGKVTASTRESYALGSNRSGTSVTQNTALDGIDFARMQAIADQAHADLVARLQAAGFNVLDDAQWRAAPSAAKLDWAKASTAASPMTVEGKSGTTETAYVLVTPTGMQNWPETVMPANLGASRALRKELDAVMLVPRLVVNYATMESSGKGKSGFFSRGSSTSVTPLVHGGAYAGGFGFDNWKARVGQHGGFIEFKPEAVLDAPGEFASVEKSEGDRASRAGNLANAITWALAGVGTFRDVHYLYYDADPDAYARLAGEALAKQNAVLVHELSKAK